MNDSSGIPMMMNSRLNIKERASTASKSHSEAERRRRERINAHLSSLRQLLPNIIRTDKASILAEVVNQVKNLKRLATEMAVTDSEQTKPSAVQLPSDTDELSLNSDPSSSSLIRASICCEDRPDLISDIIFVFRKYNLKVKRAEISTIGGRTKTVFLVESTTAGGDFRSLYRALRIIMEKSGNSLTRNAQGPKRSRHYSQQKI